MASRDRACRHLVPNVHISMPTPAQLVALAPSMKVLMDAAAEFDSIDDEGCWTAVEFVRWLDQAVRQVGRGVA